MKPVIPTEIIENGSLHNELFDTDTDFVILMSYKKDGVFPKGGTSYKVCVYDPINKKTIERHYCQNADETREKVRSLINGYKL